jgi:hypothetical protein
MRLCKFGIVAADEPKSVEGFRENPIRPNPPWPPPPRAKPGVDPATQAVATNSTARTRFMIVTPHVVSPTVGSYVIAGGGTGFSVLPSVDRSCGHPYGFVFAKMRGVGATEISAAGNCER